MRMNNMLMTLFLVLIVYTTQGQNRKLDWSERENIKSSDLLKPVKNGSLVTLTIENFNPYKLKFEVKGKRFEYVTPMPAELQTVFRISQKAKEDTKPEVSDKEQERAKDEKNELENVKAENKKRIENLKAEIEESNEEKVKLEKGNQDNKKNLSPQNMNYKKNFLVTEIESKTVEKTSLEKLEITLEELIKNSTDYLNSLDKYNELVVEAKAERTDLLEIALGENQSKKMVEKENGLKKAGGVEDKYNDIKVVYNKLERQYQLAMDMAKQEDKGKLESYWKSMEGSFAKLDVAKLITLDSDIRTLRRVLKNADSYKFTTLPTTAAGDEIDYQVTVKQLDEEGKAEATGESFPLIIPVFNGLKIDFSVGPTYSMGRGSQSDEYFLKIIPEKDSMGILTKRTNPNWNYPSIAAMLHFYNRKSKSIAWGGMFGIGAGYSNANEFDFTSYLGLSIILGRAKKLMISGGVSSLLVNRLKEKEFEQGNEYKIKDFKANDVVEKVFRPSFFFSISYAIGTRTEVN